MVQRHGMETIYWQISRAIYQFYFECKPKDLPLSFSKYRLRPCSRGVLCYCVKWWFRPGFVGSKRTDGSGVCWLHNKAGVWAQGPHPLEGGQCVWRKPCEMPKPERKSMWNGSSKDAVERVHVEQEQQLGSCMEHAELRCSIPCMGRYTCMNFWCLLK